jgi:hypothetical protein
MIKSHRRCMQSGETHSQGDHIVAPRAIYGGVHQFLEEVARARMGIQVNSYILARLTLRSHTWTPQRSKSTRLPSNQTHPYCWPRRQLTPPCGSSRRIFSSFLPLFSFSSSQRAASPHTQADGPPGSRRSSSRTRQVCCRCRWHSGVACQPAGACPPQPCLKASSSSHLPKNPALLLRHLLPLLHNSDNSL